MGLDGINSSNRAGQAFSFQPVSNFFKVNDVKVGTIQMTGVSGVNTTERKDLANGAADVTNRARMNAPVAQGLASAQEIENGQLVSGYHFDNLGKYDAKVFALKYNSANTPRIAQGTENACEGIEYAGVAGNLQAAAKNSPFAELFS